jgi:hypothetical protein
MGAIRTEMVLPSQAPKFFESPRGTGDEQRECKPFFVNPTAFETNRVRIVAAKLLMK